MYFTKENNFFHGIMFHHFHDEKIHLKSQGSISKDDLQKLIKFIGRKNILDANIFYKNLKNKKLKSNQVCFTFDDGIKSQIDIALPVLEEFKIKSFFFIYTSFFDGNFDNLEIFRFFRAIYYQNINSFYKEFNKYVNHDLDKFFKLQNQEIEYKKKHQPFYSIEDIKFRLIRDKLLAKKDYEEIMLNMMKDKEFNPKDVYANLFFSKDDIKKLDSLGHEVGLHSHEHHTLIEELSYDEQKNQYEKCKSIISKILDKPLNSIKTMSHPCGSYNEETLRILKDLGVDLGFKNIMKIEKGMKTINNSNLEIARINHALVMKMIK